VLQAQRLLETSDYSVDEVAGRCGFRSPVALRGHFRRQLGSSPAAYRAAYRARRPQGDRPGDAEGAVGPAAPQAAQESAQVPMQTRRTPPANALGTTAPLPTDHPGKQVPELYAAGRPSLPGPRSAP
jgi:hypothetical protein